MTWTPARAGVEALVNRASLYTQKGCLRSNDELMDKKISPYKTLLSCRVRSDRERRIRFKLNACGVEPSLGAASPCWAAQGEGTRLTP